MTSRTTSKTEKIDLSFFSSLKKEFRHKWFIYRVTIPVSVITEIEPDVILSKLKKRPVFDARASVIWISYHAGNIPMRSIGHVLCRDHSSVSHAISSVDSALTYNRGNIPIIIRDVLDIEDQWR